MPPFSPIMKSAPLSRERMLMPFLASLICASKPVLALMALSTSSTVLAVNRTDVKFPIAVGNLQAGLLIERFAGTVACHRGCAGLHQALSAVDVVDGIDIGGKWDIAVVVSLVDGGNYVVGSRETIVDMNSERTGIGIVIDLFFSVGDSGIIYQT